MAEGCVPRVDPAPAGVSDGKPRYRGACSCGWSANVARQKKWAAQSDAIEHANEVRPVLREATQRGQNRAERAQARRAAMRPGGGGGSAA